MSWQHQSGLHRVQKLHHAGLYCVQGITTQVYSAFNVHPLLEDEASLSLTELADQNHVSVSGQNTFFENQQVDHINFRLLLTISL